MTKVETFMSALVDPDHVGQAEYRAIHEVLTDAHDSPERIESILHEFVDQAEGLLYDLGRPRRPPCQTVLLELRQVKDSEDLVLRKVKAEHPEHVQVVSRIGAAHAVDEECVSQMTATDRAAVEAL